MLFRSAKTAPGSAVKPGYALRGESIEMVLKSPESAPADYDAQGEADVKTLEVYGFQISAEGVIDKNDVVVEFSWKNRAASQAGLQRGDVITHIEVGDRMEKVRNRAEALRFLVGRIAWGSTVRLRVQRGMPHPFSSHPRLDLFVGSLSPHKLQDFVCTTCHDGLGSATAIKWANHAPNELLQAYRWVKKHCMLVNHFWIFHMKPRWLV